MVDSTGLTVPPCDPSALALAWEQILTKSPKERRDLGKAARDRIALAANYALEKVTLQYESLYRNLAQS